MDNNKRIQELVQVAETLFQERNQVMGIADLQYRQAQVVVQQIEEMKKTLFRELSVEMKRVKAEATQRHHQALQTLEAQLR